MATLQLGLIGKKLSHSFSKEYFDKKFLDLNIDAQYDLYEIESERAIRNFLANTEATAFNVTIPYKQSILQFIQEPDSIVIQCGATNCIKKIGTNRWAATNTDVLGFRKNLEPLLKNHHQSAIILGNGGAAQAVKHVLRKLNISFITVSRNILPGVISYSDISDEYLHDKKIIINCTPIGMFPEIDASPPINYNALTEQHLCFDLIYNPMETLFMSKSRASGAVVCNGMEMLKIQAEEGWAYFNSVKF